MTYGKTVAERFKRQYFKHLKWQIYPDWEIQPESIYTILLELSTKKAIECLLGKSWTRRLPKKV